jgi:hypothetical protein
MLRELQAKSLRGWPTGPIALDIQRVGEQVADGVRLEAFQYASDENLRLPLYVVQAVKHPHPDHLVVDVMDDAAWNQWLGDFAPVFGELLSAGKAAGPDGIGFPVQASQFEQRAWALAIVAPRGIGPNQWDPDPREDTHIRRRLVLLGKSADEGRVWDVRRAIDSLRQIPTLSKARVSVRGRRQAAGIGLYAGIFHPEVDRIELLEPTSTHRDGPFLLNVLRILDLPQAAALAFPRTVAFYGADPDQWDWSRSIARLYDPNHPPIEFHKLPDASGTATGGSP